MGLQPTDLTSHIRPLPSSTPTQTSHTALFLLTPAFAHWLRDHDDFIHKALRQLYAPWLDASTVDRIDSFVAVVDKLPTPTQSDTDGASLVADTGHEGLAYLSLNNDALDHALPLDGHQQASISFMSAVPSSDGQSSHTDSVRLPLANTIFQTGSPSTLMHATWRKNKEDAAISLKDRMDLSALSLRLQQRSKSTLSVPLIPLTPPRKVEETMGNILRRVIGAQGQSVSASEELEQVVHQYFKARSESPRAMPVWALLIPKDMLSAYNSRLQDYVKTVHQDADTISHDTTSGSPLAQLSDGWKRDPPVWNTLVASSLSHGARLHRVLSGGGGWGKKAGLLSLDPSALRDDTTSFDLPDYSENVDGFSTALHKIVAEGDSIQFFVSPVTTALESGTSDGSQRDQSQVLDQLAQLCRNEPTRPVSLDLGIVPSTVDVIDGSTWQHSGSETKEAIHFERCFGALSEAGIIVKREYRASENDSIVQGSATKIDVPFSRISATAAEREGE